MASFNAASSDRRETARNDDMRLLSHDTATRYDMMWPVDVIMPIYTRGPHPITHRAFRFRYSPESNTLLPLGGPLSMEHVHFLLDCLVVSYGRQRVHLGRYHPQSNPEQFTSQNQPPDTDTLNNDPNYFAQFRAERNEQRNLMRIRTALEVPDPNDPTEFRGYYLDLPIIVNRRTSNSSSEPARNRNRASTARTINELKYILERLLDNDELFEFEQARCLADILELMPEGTHPPIPHFPVGNLEFEECGICCNVQFSYRRPCCDFSACTSCLKRYYASRVEIGQVRISCCNPDCNKFVHKDEVTARLDSPFKEQFNTLVLLANQDENTKTCPRCNHLTEFGIVRKLPRDPDHPNYPR
ncbi:uncharacterized protein TNIN_338551 [Trichonephila inaurata madagascariensis]|uniref:Uncharacterized protein n=1 Tax=Trichonephila inaurata madagascariensis TaxID=2747483 RepID=A0A8X6YKF0_9ARAC|nr:uncharacterized protein TNIN_338551 [Trichonephila inaurata madagascariensis]